MRERLANRPSVLCCQFSVGFASTKSPTANLCYVSEILKPLIQFLYWVSPSADSNLFLLHFVITSDYHDYSMWFYSAVWFDLIQLIFSNRLTCWSSLFRIVVSAFEGISSWFFHEFKIYCRSIISLSCTLELIYLKAWYMTVRHSIQWGFEDECLME